MGGVGGFVGCGVPLLLSKWKIGSRKNKPKDANAMRKGTRDTSTWVGQQLGIFRAPRALPLLGLPVEKNDRVRAQTYHRQSVLV